jgi:hypothetical protein
VRHSADRDTDCFSVRELACTQNVPANAPHAFTNATGTPSRLLSMCAPSGQEEFFTLVGRPVALAPKQPRKLEGDGLAAFIAKSTKLALGYRTELLPPPGADEGGSGR